MNKFLLYSLLLLSLVAVFAKSAPLSSNSLLGVSPEDIKYYKTSSEFFNCKDGSKKIHIDQLNDDFCDCLDGSDEPGTSACSNGKFYCQNTGHIPLGLFSSRVNDGICDCCDGSDEYDGMIKCANTCLEEGDAARDELQKKITAYQQGITIKNKEIEQFAKDEAELAKLKEEEKILKGLVQDLKDRLEKDKEAKTIKNADKKAIDGEKTESGNQVPDQVTNDDSIGNFDQEREVPLMNEALLKEELGRLVASRWTGGQKISEADPPEDNVGQGAIPEDVHNEEDDGNYSDMNEDDEVYNNDHHDSKDTEDDHGDSNVETHLSGGMSWIKKIQRTLRNILFWDPARARKEYDEYSSKLSKIQSKISILSHKLKQDFGPEKELYSFYDKCFESKEKKYVYKICPFQQATQIDGHSTHRLGRWEKFEESNKVMVFANGDNCYNGPDRSLKVRLICGLGNEITDIAEPSRCKYVASLTTPNVCNKEMLEELKSKLEMMDRNRQPQIHDEF